MKNERLIARRRKAPLSVATVQKLSAPSQATDMLGFDLRFADTAAVIGMMNRLRHGAAIVAILWGVSTTQAAFAQEKASPNGRAAPDQAESTESEQEISEIIVTAQKRAENIQEVPIAITAISGERLNGSGVASTQDLQAITPGLSIPSTGGFAILPRIRGVGQGATTTTLENPVAVYVDGVYYASAGGSIFSLSNISQVAVLKGPQGTLFGRNATGGVIQITTRKPSPSFEGNANLTVGNRETGGGNLYLTGPLAENVSADFAAHYLNQGKGFGRNEFTGNDVHKSKELNLRGKVLFGIGENTDLTLAGDYSKLNSIEPGFVIRNGVPQLPTVYPSDLGDFDIYSEFDPLVKTKQYGGSATLEHKFGSVTFTSITAYRRTTNDLALESDFGQFEIGKVSAGQVEKQFSQELQLSSASDGPFKWTLGAYYFDLKGFYRPFVNVKQAFGLVNVRINASPSAESVAGYAQGTYAVTDRLNVTAGLRYTTEERRHSGTSTVALLPPITPVPVTIVTTSDSKGRFSKLTWRLALDYQINPDAMVYASYNRGFKSGGFNPTEFPSFKFEPEVIDAYEIGGKFDFADRRVRINPSFYYYKYTNLQVGIFVEGLQLIRNAAKATIYGLDVDIEARVTDRFTVLGGGSWSHGRYDSFPGAQFSTPLTLAQGGGNALRSDDAAGKRLQQAPDWTLNLGLEYRLPIGARDLTLNGTYFHSDGFFGEAENRQRQKPYDLVNLSASYPLSSSTKFTLWGKNIFNEVYAVQLVTAAAGDAQNVAPGRTFGATLGIEF